MLVVSYCKHLFFLNTTYHNAKETVDNMLTSLRKNFFRSQAQRAGSRQILEARKKLHKPELFLPKHGRFGIFNTTNLQETSSTVAPICVSDKKDLHICPCLLLKKGILVCFAQYFLSSLSKILQAKSGLRSWNFTCPVRILQVSDIGLVLSFEDWLTKRQTDGHHQSRVLLLPICTHCFGHLMRTGIC